MIGLGRGHRLRAVHRHPLPRAAARGPHRRGVDRHRHRHRRPGRHVRRHHRGDLAARHAPHGRELRAAAWASAPPTVVAVTMVASLTLLPALLGFAGDARRADPLAGPHRRRAGGVGLLGAGPQGRSRCWSAFPLAVIVLIAGLFVGPLKREVPRREPKPLRETLAYRWSRVVQHHPWPMAHRRHGVPAGPRHSRVRHAPGLLRRGQRRPPTPRPPGLRPAGRGLRARVQRPAHLVAAVPEGTDPSPPSPASPRRSTPTPGVAFVSPPVPNDPADPTAVLWNVIPTTAPQDEATTDLVNRLRDDVLPGHRRGRTWTSLVTGFVAVTVDFSDYLGDRLPAVLRRRAHAVVPAADGRVPVAAGAAQGRDHEPAVDRRRLRRRGRDLPVGLGQATSSASNRRRSSRSSR